jgi:DNA-binding NarL/FixJ family response regulator
MTTDPEAHHLLDITRRQAEILRELAEGRSMREIAEALGIAVTGVRSHVQRIKALTGCHDVRDLGRLWRRHRVDWAHAQLRAGGIDPSELGRDDRHPGR